MATSKVKGTSKKIKELKGVKAEKINEEQLTKVQSIVTRINSAYIDLGRLEATKHNRLHTLAGMQDELLLMQEDFKKEYGSDNINVETGQITYEDGEAN